MPLNIFDIITSNSMLLGLISLMHMKDFEYLTKSYIPLKVIHSKCQVIEEPVHMEDVNDIDCLENFDHHKVDPTL